MYCMPAIIPADAPERSDSWFPLLLRSAFVVCFFGSIRLTTPRTMTSRFPTAEEFASFPPPNYVDAPNHLPLALAVVVPMTVLVSVFISCRFYCRTVLIKTLGWDDGTMLVAAVSFVAYVSSTRALGLTLAGVGHREQCHAHYIHAARISNGLSSMYVGIWFAREP